MPVPVWKDKAIPKNKRVLAAVLLMVGSLMAGAGSVILLLSTFLWPSAIKFPNPNFALVGLISFLLFGGFIIVTAGYVIIRKYRK